MGTVFIVLVLISVFVGLLLVVVGVPESAKSRDTDGEAGFGTTTSKGVAIVKVYGPIQMKEEKYAFSSDKGSDGIVKELKKLRKDSRVKAIVLRINSPGGTIGASQEIHNEIKTLVKNTPVVVSMGDVCASGGYYISAPATYVFANPGTITGSIGVITQTLSYHKVLEKIGVEMPTFKSGEYKDMGAGHRPMTDGERKLFMNIVTGAYEQFVDAVTAGRVLDEAKDKEKLSKTGRKVRLKSRDEVKKWADGRVFLGQEAEQLGFVDELGDLEAAVRKAGDLAGLGPDPKIIKGGSGSLDELFDKLGADVFAPSLPAKLMQSLDRSGAPILYLYEPGL